MIRTHTHIDITIHTCIYSIYVCIFFAGLASACCQGCKSCRCRLLLTCSAIAALYVGLLGWLFPTQIVVKLFHHHISQPPAITWQPGHSSTRSHTFLFYSFFKCSRCLSVPNSALRSCPRVTPDTSLTLGDLRFLSCYQGKAMSASVTLLTDIKKFLWRTHGCTRTNHTHMGKYGS